MPQLGDKVRCSNPPCPNHVKWMDSKFYRLDSGGQSGTFCSEECFEAFTRRCWYCGVLLEKDGTCKLCEPKVPKE